MSQMLNSFHYFQEDLEQDNGHFSVLVQRKSGLLSLKTAHKVNGTFTESRHPVFRVTIPLSRGQLKSKGGGKLSIHYCADLDTIKTVFRIIVSAMQISSVFTEQSRRYVKNMKPFMKERRDPL